MHKMLAGLLVVSLFIVGCGEGTVKLSGEAFLKTRGGSVITCAGSAVYLEKYSKGGYLVLADTIRGKEKNLRQWGKLLIEYQKDDTEIENSIMSSIGTLGEYHYEIIKAEKALEAIRAEASKISTLISSVEKKVITLNLQLKELSQTKIIKTECNRQGAFSFNTLEEGKYYISTTVQWDVGGSQQGGSVHKIVELKSGDNRVILSMQ